VDARDAKGAERESKKQILMQQQVVQRDPEDDKPWTLKKKFFFSKKSHFLYLFFVNIRIPEKKKVFWKKKEFFLLNIWYELFFDENFFAKNNTLIISIYHPGWARVNFCHDISKFFTESIIFKLLKKLYHKKKHSK